MTVSLARPPTLSLTVWTIRIIRPPISSREIYSVTFSQPSPDEGSSQDEDVIQGGEQEGDATTSRSAGGGTGSVRGRSSLADAYSRKVVRQRDKSGIPTDIPA